LKRKSNKSVYTTGTPLRVKNVLDKKNGFCLLISETYNYVNLLFSLCEMWQSIEDNTAK